MNSAKNHAIFREDLAGREKGWGEYTLNLIQSSLESSIDGDGTVLIANIGCWPTSDGANLNSGGTE